MRARPEGKRGFTLVELLLVVVLTTIGFVGLFDLQASSIRGMGNMVRMQQAVQLGENFIEQLRLEFSAWTPTESLNNPGLFPHLANLPTDDAARAGVQTPGDEVANGPGWVIADRDKGDDRRVSAVGDAHPGGFNKGLRLAMLNTDVEDADQHFCLLYRLTWLQPNRLIRVEVEVAWALQTADINAFMKCNTSAGSKLNEMRSITLTSTLAINVFKR